MLFPGVNISVGGTSLSVTFLLSGAHDDVRKPFLLSCACTRSCYILYSRTFLPGKSVAKQRNCSCWSARSGSSTPGTLLHCTDKAYM